MPWFEVGQSYPGPGPPPGPDQVALGIELENGRCREAALLGTGRIEGREYLVGRQIPSMDDPNVIPRVYPQADRRAEQPMIRQRLRPERIHLEHRCQRGVRNRRIGRHIHGRPDSTTATTGGAKDDKGSCCEVLGRHRIPLFFQGKPLWMGSERAGRKSPPRNQQSIPHFTTVSIYVVASIPA